MIPNRRTPTSHPGRRALTLATSAVLALALAACGGADSEARDGTPDDAATPDAVAADTATGAAGLMNPNEATEEELRGLAGLSDSAAAVLVAGRPYADMVALDDALSGHLDASEREALYREMWIPLDLNRASEAEILLIPGVGDRMAHEFEEYRPYRGIEEFRREIGKYVDEDEVARLEQYVTLRE